MNGEAGGYRLGRAASAAARNQTIWRGGGEKLKRKYLFSMASRSIRVRRASSAPKYRRLRVSSRRHLARLRAIGQNRENWRLVWRKLAGVTHRRWRRENDAI